MDARNATEILNSPDEIKVYYKGSPVWIQKVDGNMARVKFMDSGSEDQVPVQGLEQGH